MTDITCAFLDERGERRCPIRVELDGEMCSQHLRAEQRRRERLERVARINAAKNAEIEARIARDVAAGVKRCAHVRPSGEQCGQRMLQADPREFCDHHDPDKIALRVEQAEFEARKKVLEEKARLTNGIAGVRAEFERARDEVARTTSLANAAREDLKAHQKRLRELADEVELFENRRTAAVVAASTWSPGAVLEMLQRTHAYLAQRAELDLPHVLAMLQWCASMTEHQRELRLRASADKPKQPSEPRTNGSRRPPSVYESRDTD